ncbi:MAG TPA: hypothetical protein VI670_10210 [Thermoanaerobaculia bacterium]
MDEVYAVSLDCLQESIGVERAGHTPWRPETENPEPVLVSDAELAPVVASYLPVFRAEAIRALGAVEAERERLAVMKIRDGAVESCRDVPAIAIAAFVHSEGRERILAAGFHDRVEKPVDATVIPDAVRKLLAAGDARSEAMP